jgi:hypothetical protein
MAEHFIRTTDYKENKWANKKRIVKKDVAGFDPFHILPM